MNSAFMHCSQKTGQQLRLGKKKKQEEENAEAALKCTIQTYTNSGKTLIILKNSGIWLFLPHLMSTRTSSIYKIDPSYPTTKNKAFSALEFEIHTVVYCLYSNPH